MSDQLYGEAGNEAAQGFEPLPDPNKQPDDEKTYSGDARGLREAAEDHADSGHRSQTIERKYVGVGEDNAGEDIPANKTLKLDRAARDLSEIHQSETSQAEDAAAEQFAETVDQARADALGENYKALTGQPEITPQPETAEPEAASGADEEFSRLLKNPTVRQALESELAASEAIRQHYGQSVMQAAQVAAAALYSSFPELNGIAPQNLPAALQVLSHQNPQRYNEVRAHLGRVENLYGAAMQAQETERRMVGARFNEYVKQQDDAMDAFLKSEPEETVRRVKEEIVDIAEKTYGVSKQEFAQLYHSNPVVRSVPFQRMMYDAARFNLAQRSAREAVAKPLPPVMRPGVASNHNADAEASIQSLSAQVSNAKGDKQVRLAAQLQAARRAARS